jgi:uncharacterized protein YuzE
MKFVYDAGLDQLGVSLRDGKYWESSEIADGFVVDFDKDGNVLGFDVEYASKKLDLTKIDLGELGKPIDSRKAA